MKYAGVAYLVFLGLQAITAALRHKPSGPGAPPAPRQPRGPVASWRRGLLSDLGNPKMAVFFTSLLPQFGSHFAALALLGLVFCAMTFAWLVCYAVAIARMGDLLRRTKLRRALDAATGTVLIVLGVRLATEQR